IGPVAADSNMTADEMIEEYMSIGETFQDEEVDVILFETFPELEIIVPVIEYLKKRKNVPVIVQFCVNQFGYSNAGLSARKLFADAKNNSYIDGIGLNCGVGPSHMAQLMKELDIDGEKLVTALPNAGYPKLVQNRLTFNNNIDCFEEKITELAEYGVDILGGCCGTNPSYIKGIVENTNLAHNQKKKNISAGEQTGGPVAKDSFLSTREKDSSHKLIAVELAPPINNNDEKLLDAAHILKAEGVDIVTFPDSPSGRTRADAVLMAEKVHRETGLRVMPHMCCRDKNAIAIRSTILGAHLNDIKDFLVITGDPVPVMFRQTTKSVFNFDSIGMMKILQGMNEEIFGNDQITFGGAINHNKCNIRFETDRIKRKMEAGAEFFMTQPVFSKAQADIVHDMKLQTGATILIGIMPLVSKRNAMFMKNEMTGINIPDEVIDRYSEGMTREEGEACGISIAKEIMEYTASFADGYYFSFPFNRVHMLKQILQ
ncbi:MAG: bifunctional homocysteine S-methyltransferase/methylenetetrahydrofolate reductase, partial [Coprococcus sp.]